ncbi:MAG TPA: hypothetical protein VMU67_09440 [Steroidobacteraceae bacterium]|nr:hypothetical protein [Steroidobacteraceae bacterium]
MPDDPKSVSFDQFMRWFGEAGARSESGLEPSVAVMEAARAAHRAFQSVQRTHRNDIADRVQSGTYVEELEVLAAADSDHTGWLPRLRTPNGFTISPLYTSSAAEGSPPIGLLVECPVELVEACRGQTVRVAAGGQWIELGQVDVDGKATGDLPAGFAFKPPFVFRVGELAEQSAELPRHGEPE